jgi:hypothetical protein
MNKFKLKLSLNIFENLTFLVVMATYNLIFLSVKM